MSTNASEAVGMTAAGARRAAWSTRFAFIMAAAGSAVGLGNVWKFPYITGEYGGGAFVVFYLFCIALIGLPIMMAEVMLGRRGQHSPINAMRALAVREGRSPAWKIVGVLATVTAFIILSFYSVVAGWALPYVFHAAGGAFSGESADAISGMFGRLLGNPGELILWHTVFMGLTVAVSAAGVRGGLERAVTWLMPALLVMLLVLVGYNLFTGGLGEGLAFLFEPDFSKLSAEGMLTALGHSFFTLSLASGAMMAYGSYLPRSTSIARASVTVALMDTAVALTAGLAIFPVVFANGLEPGAGPGLVFQTLPIAFSRMPGGDLVGTLFFVLLVFAAWTSSISLLESLVAWLEERGVSRATAAVGGGFAAWLVGLTTVFSLNIWSGFNPLGMFEYFQGKTLFDLYDFLTTNVMMPLGALLMAVFVGWVMKPSSSEEELAMGGAYRWWRMVMRYLVPLGVIAIFVYNLG